MLLFLLQSVEQFVIFLLQFCVFASETGCGLRLTVGVEGLAEFAVLILEFLDGLVGLEQVVFLGL